MYYNLGNPDNWRWMAREKPAWGKPGATWLSPFSSTLAPAYMLAAGGDVLLEWYP
jgi:hypothetical protein